MQNNSLRPALYMLPVDLGGVDPKEVLPTHNMEIMSQLRHFIVENVRTARRFLRACQRDFPIDECEFMELNGHTDPKDISGFLAPLRQGNPVGVMSEAGCPGVADPGADVVAIAQREGLEVVPLIGPSSILLGLMASGFNGQGFAFRGYLPVKTDDRISAIKQLESAAAKLGQTQIFIETPYRNNAMLTQLAETLRPDTLLCVATAITTPQESIRTRTAEWWRKNKSDLAKLPTIFLLHRPR